MYGLSPGQRSCNAVHQNEDTSTTPAAASRSVIRRLTGPSTPTRKASASPGRMIHASIILVTNPQPTKKALSSNHFVRFPLVSAWTERVNP
jgi:hypothetical protein